MTEQVCPACGCQIGSDAFEKDSVVYCCKPCATHGACKCGCYRPAKDDKSCKG